MHNDNNIINLNDKKETSIDTGLALIGSTTVANILDAVRNIPVMKEDDMNFLKEKSEHLGKVMERTHMWRTDLQKVSIINDVEFPTIHSKFHQSILEQKVQFDNAMFLAKDYEDAKFDMEKLEIEISELEYYNKNILGEREDINELSDECSYFEYKRNEIDIKKKKLELQFKAYTLQQMRIAMDYRMQEVKGWQVIEENLINTMNKEGLSEEEIWTKSTNEIEGTFLHTMTRLQSLHDKLSSAEYNNLIAAAVHCYNQAHLTDKLDEYRRKCNPQQLDSLIFIEKNVFNNFDKGNYPWVNFEDTNK